MGARKVCCYGYHHWTVCSTVVMVTLTGQSAAMVTWLLYTEHFVAMVIITEQSATVVTAAMVAISWLVNSLLSWLPPGLPSLDSLVLWIHANIPCRLLHNSTAPDCYTTRCNATAHYMYTYLIIIACQSSPGPTEKTRWSSICTASLMMTWWNFLDDSLAGYRPV